MANPKNFHKIIKQQVKQRLAFQTYLDTEHAWHILRLREQVAQEYPLGTTTRLWYYAEQYRRPIPRAQEYIRAQGIAMEDEETVSSSFYGIRCFLRLTLEQAQEIVTFIADIDRTNDQHAAYTYARTHPLDFYPDLEVYRMEEEDQTIFCAQYEILS